jgi:5-methylcytosine-specific restriction endonuclease McrA
MSTVSRGIRKEEKACSRCGEVKPTAEFGRLSATGTKRKARCKGCDLKYQREWREKNKERVAAKQKARYRAKHDERLAYHRRWRMAKKGAPLTEAGEEFVNVLLGDPCSYCGEPADTVDHIVAIKDGGDSDWDNLTAACINCNSRKQRQPLLIALAFRNGFTERHEGWASNDPEFMRPAVGRKKAA